MRKQLDRSDYAKLQRGECERRLREAQDRAERAETMEDSMADLFAIQELQARLQGFDQ